MSYITLKCKHFNSLISFDTSSKYGTCSHCGSTFLLSELFDEKDLSFIEKLKQEDIEKRASYTTFLRKGESSIYQGQFDKAEQYFKKAIEINGNDYRGYFGVVKAKSHNFNILPDDSDIFQYAKLAKKFADNDDSSFVKNELDKLNILKIEKKQILNEKKQREENLKKMENKRLRQEKVYTKVLFILFIVVMSCLFVFLFIFSNYLNFTSSFKMNFNLKQILKIIKFR